MVAVDTMVEGRHHRADVDPAALGHKLLAVNLSDLAAMGAGGAICFASGWEEAGEAGLQAQLVTAAGKMPILGPNC